MIIKYMDKFKYSLDRNSKIMAYKFYCKNILEKLINILGITEEKNNFSLYEMDLDQEKINNIIGLEEEVKQYFATSRMSYFNNKKENNESNRPYLNLTRNILNAMKVKYYNKVTTITINGIKHNTIKYYINIDSLNEQLGKTKTNII